MLLIRLFKISSEVALHMLNTIAHSRFHFAHLMPERLDLAVSCKALGFIVSKLVFVAVQAV